jgi:hypothetical protein
LHDILWSDAYYNAFIIQLHYWQASQPDTHIPAVYTVPAFWRSTGLQDEIARLKQQLQDKGSGGGGKSGKARVIEKVVEVTDETEVERVREAMRAELEAKMKEDLSAEALEKAKEEATSRAKAQLEVTSHWVVSCPPEHMA